LLFEDVSRLMSPHSQEHHRVRHRRRHDQLAAAGRAIPLEDVIADIARRGHRDTTRADSPLTRDESYTAIDASDLSIDEVVEVMARAVEERRRAGPD